MVHLALRLLFKAGRSVAEVRELVDKMEHDDTDHHLQMPQSPITYEHVYRMTHHLDMFPDELMIAFALSACLLTKIAQMSGFLEVSHTIRMASFPNLCIWFTGFT